METSSFYRYLNDVLGIESIVTPAAEKGQNVQVEGEGPVMFLGASVLSDPHEKELLSKMIVAMGLDPARVYVAEGEPTSFKAIANYSFRMLVLLGSEVCRNLTGNSFEAIRGELFTENNWQILVTHDPKSLLKNSDLKKQAWGDLKKVIPLLKT